MSDIQYTVGQKPTKPGIYAVRVPMDDAPYLLEDRFLMWMDGRWCHLRSDQYYRGEVTAWIGPLPRKLPARSADQTGGAA